MKSGNNTRNRILQAALDAFSTYGYEGTRMEKIAADVGINKASLYFHFEGKDELFLIVFEQIIERYHRVRAHIFDTHKDLPIKERLTQIYSDYLEYHRDNREMDFWNRVYYYPPEPFREKIIIATTESAEELIDALTDIMKEGIRNDCLQKLDPRSMALSYYYILTCISLSMDLLNFDNILANMTSCFEIFWNGVKNK